MVSFCCEILLLCAAALMLTFFIAGLLFICASSTSITWERTPHPVRRPAFSSHLVSSTMPLATVPLRRLSLQAPTLFSVTFVRPLRAAVAVGAADLTRCSRTTFCNPWQRLRASRPSKDELALDLKVVLVFATFSAPKVCRRHSRASLLLCPEHL